MKRLWMMMLLLAVAVPVTAQDPPEQAGDEAEEAENPFADFEKLVDGAELHEGFFDMYTKGDKLYLVVPSDRLRDDFLMEYKIARGIGAANLFGGTMLNLFEGNVMALEKHGEKIYLMQRPHRFHADQDEAAAAAVDLTFGSSVVQSAEVAAIRPDSAEVIEVSGWFVSDMSGVGQRVRFAVSTTPGQPGTANFDKSRSFLESVKGFADNVNVRAKLTFGPSRPAGFSSVPDNRYLPVSVHYTLARLPEQPMAIRLGDERVGNFWTVHKDFSQEDSTFFVRMTNRWRLERGERDGNLWRPVEPITYYIDRTVPDEYRDDFKAGVEAWNEAYEAAGWSNAIRALDLPDDADAEDIRYATLRWNVSDQAGYGAIGPSTVDPRTGEILDADILFEAGFFGGFRNTWKNLVSPVSAGEALEAALGIGETPEALAGIGGQELSTFAEFAAAQGVLAGALLASRGEIGVGDELPREVLSEFVRWVVMHEVGHTLGLQHNFRSSASTPFDRLHDKEWTRDNGVFSSVMEYPQINVSPNGSPNGYYYNPGIGSYDRWAISFSYTPDGAEAKRIARDGAAKGHMYGNEAGGAGALDPSINIWDLGDDPLAWGAQRTEMIRGLWADLPSYALEDDGQYSDLTGAFQSLINMYAQALAPAVKYIGGQYLNRDHVGDPNARMPFENVPLAEQREALYLIVDRAFRVGALEPPQELLAQLGSNRWTHWGSNTSFQGRLDYPYHEQVLGFQSAMLGQLLHPWRLARIRDAETKFGADQVVTIPELMESLRGAIWTELGDGGGNIDATRRDLQRAYLDRMTTIIVTPPSRMPADARSVARMELTELSGQIAAAQTTGLDAYTRAHLAESEARIKKALEAGLEAEGN